MEDDRFRYEVSLKKDPLRYEKIKRERERELETKRETKLPPISNNSIGDKSSWKERLNKQMKETQDVMNRFKQQSVVVEDLESGTKSFVPSKLVGTVYPKLVGKLPPLTSSNIQSSSKEEQPLFTRLPPINKGPINKGGKKRTKKQKRSRRTRKHRKNRSGRHTRSRKH